MGKVYFAHWKLLAGWLIFRILSCCGFIGIALLGSGRTMRHALLGMALMALALIVLPNAHFTEWTSRQLRIG
jgi:hypothetical protein